MNQPVFLYMLFQSFRLDCPIPIRDDLFRYSLADASPGRLEHPLSAMQDGEVVPYIKIADGLQSHPVFASMTLTHTAENLLMFQEIFMENIPSHYRLVESFALFNGNSKILQVSNPIIQMWAVDPPPSVASPSASSSASQLPGSCNILPTRPSQTNHMLVFTLESIFLLPSV